LLYAKCTHEEEFKRILHNSYQLNLEQPSAVSCWF